jgi:hypothetical protein
MPSFIFDREGSLLRPFETPRRWFPPNGPWVERKASTPEGRGSVSLARGGTTMATEKQHHALSTAEKDELPESDFAFPKQRKEPLVDAAHVRNAVARFGQVEDVSDQERDAAWKRIRKAAGRSRVEIEADDWRELHRGGRTPKKR